MIKIRKQIKCMDRTSKLILESNGEELVAFDFNEKDIEKATTNAASIILKNTCMGLTINDRNEVSINILATIGEQLKLVYDNGVELNLNELYNTQKMIGNMERQSMFSTILTCLDLDIAYSIISLMCIKDINDKVHISMLGVAENLDEETVKPIEIGNYELKYEYHTAIVDNSCQEALPEEAMDIVREAVNNYDSTIELKIRPKK